MKKIKKRKQLSNEEINNLDIFIQKKAKRLTLKNYLFGPARKED